MNDGMGVDGTNGGAMNDGMGVSRTNRGANLSRGIANDEGWNCYLGVNIQGLRQSPPFTWSLAEGCPLEADCDDDECTREILCHLVLHQRPVASLLHLEEQLEMITGGVMLEGFQQDSQELLRCLLRNLRRERAGGAAVSEESKSFVDYVGGGTAILLKHDFDFCKIVSPGASDIWGHYGSLQRLGGVGIEVVQRDSPLVVW
ncbi:hypothetical protein FB45DRAFT_883284 [Roridomyces roridus]|uniref:Uncharacterized protein n=1 Tax=Roridomyces roridus TaxID=1738132 RepID=A0AAD7AX03_9AGAR|nr:hypothetical protein FB45DRAFT_883284 [Roridomyces roridus]